jgi:bacterioferritin-associated ferredoxin
MSLSAVRERESQYTSRMDIREAKPIGTRCKRCDGQANVLIEEGTADRPIEESVWTCPRCHAANAISVRGKVVGVAFASGHVVSGPPR